MTCAASPPKGGFATRDLYTTDSESAIDAKRPVLLTAITNVITRGDLADRAIIVKLSPRSGEGGSEDELWARFHADAPRIFGAMLDAMAAAMHHLPDTKTGWGVRLNDFARWVVAAEAALPWERGAFMDAYRRNRDASAEAALEANEAAAALLLLLDHTPAWRGTMGALLIELTNRTPEQVTRGQSWPTRAEKLRADITRAAPELRRRGIVATRLRAKSKAGHVYAFDTGDTPRPEGEPLI